MNTNEFISTPSTHGNTVSHTKPDFRHPEALLAMTNSATSRYEEASRGNKSAAS